MIVEDKVIAISGVGAGLGRTLAGLALRDGARVFLGARTRSTLERVALETDPSGERVGFCRVDINDRERCRSFAAAALERFGRIDALVNLAALDTAFGSIEDSEPEDWRPSLETNVIGTLQLTKEVVPRLRDAGGGAIVFIGSQASYLPQTQQLAYAASKAALATAVRYLAKELGPSGIRVNSVVPTWMWGQAVEHHLTKRAAESGESLEALVQEITAGMALGAIPTEADVAEAVLFMASDRARAITGQALLVNAGEMYL